MASDDPFVSASDGCSIGDQVLNIPAPTLVDRLKELDLANDIPHQVQETTLACLEKESARRSQSAREVAERLRIHSAHTASLSVPRNPAPSRRKLGLIRAAPSVAVALALAAGRYWGMLTGEK